MESINPLSIATARTGSIVLPGIVQIETAPTRHGTLIAPDLIVVASHYLPAEGTAVTATGIDSVQPSVVGSIVKQIGDITVIRLKYPMEGVPFAKVASEGEVSAATEWIGTGYSNINTALQRDTAARMTLQRFQSDSAAPGAKVAFFKQSTMSKVEKGDSGSAVYVKAGDTLKLGAIFTSMNLMSSTASLLSPFKPQIDSLSS